jgi:hypothetical protein
MTRHCWKTLRLGILIATTAGTPVLADGWPAHEGRGSHAPIFVRTPNTHHSIITPYYFGYHLSHYSYNSPGPVFQRMHYHGPANGCRLFRYNYLYWIC